MKNKSAPKKKEKKEKKREKGKKETNTQTKQKKWYLLRKKIRPGSDASLGRT